MQGYVYRFLNTITGKSYVGSTTNLKKRKALHLHLLKSGSHHCAHLQSAWRKYGEAAFIFEVLENDTFLNEDALRACENTYFEKFAGLLYNAAPRAESVIGVKRDSETRAKQSAALRGRTFSEAARIHMAEAQQARSPATRNIQPMIDARRGSTLTPEHRTKIGLANKRRQIGDATRAKISAAKHGSHHTAESRARMSAAQHGRTHTEETKAKIRHALLGKPKSLEAINHHAASLSGRPNGALVCAPDGTIHCVLNVTAFARQHGLHQQSLSAVILGRRKSHKGWTRLES